jgi:hypothetical protein
VERDPKATDPREKLLPEFGVMVNATYELVEELNELPHPVKAKLFNPEAPV